MGKSTATDDQIREAFGRLGSKRAVVKELGVGWGTVARVLGPDKAEDDAAGQVVEITTDTILVDGQDAPLRGADGLDDLAESIRDVGLLSPIVVRPAPQAGFYRLVAGRHRLAAFDRLGRAAIPAIVLDLDDDRAAYAELSENLDRAPLAGPDLDAALARFKAVYQRLHPDTTVSGRRRAQAAPAPAPADPTETHLVAPAPTPRYDEVAAQKLGVSPRKVREAARRGAAFDGADRAILKAAGVGQKEANALAQIENPDLRKNALVFIESGDSPADAVANAASSTLDLTGEERANLAAVVGALEALAKAKGSPAGPADPGAPGEAVGPGDDPEVPEPDPADEGLPEGAIVVEVGPPEWATAPGADDPMQDDAAWLATLPVRDQLAEGTPRWAFDRDALAYRRLNAEIRNLREASASYLGSMGSGPRGPLVWTLSRLSRLPHPRQWKPCLACKGKGLSCEECRGCGYRIS